MKHKKIKIAAALVVVGLIGGVIYNQVTAKKSYDYSDYYVETKTSKKESIKENEEASEKELSLSLLKKTNKDVVGVLEFDDCINYEPIVQHRIMISMFEEILKNNMVMQKFHLYWLKKY